MTEIVIALLVLPDGRLAFQRRDGGTKISPNKLALFGGHIEPGEQPQQAIYRELSEETSLKLLESEIVPAGDYKIMHVDLGGEEFHYHLYRVDVADANFSVYEGSGAEVYTAQEALERDDITNSARRAIVNFLGDK